MCKHLDFMQGSYDLKQRHMAQLTFSDRATRKSSMRTQEKTDLPWIITCVCCTCRHTAVLS